MTSEHLNVKHRRQSHHSSPLNAVQSTPQPSYQNSNNSLQCLNFDQFFERFDLDSPVSKYFETLSLDSLWNLIGIAFTSVSVSAPGSPSLKSIKHARLVLDSELELLDTTLKLMQGSRVEVGEARDSLQWLRAINRILLDDDFLDHVHSLQTSQHGPPGDSNPRLSTYQDDSLPYWKRYPGRFSQCTRGYCGRYSISRSLTGQELLAKFPSGHEILYMINNQAQGRGVITDGDGPVEQDYPASSRDPSGFSLEANPIAMI